MIWILATSRTTLHPFAEEIFFDIPGDPLRIRPPLIPSCRVAVCLFPLYRIIGYADGPMVVSTSAYCLDRSNDA